VTAAIAPNETEMAYQLVQRGPLSILIDASWLSSYKSGKPYRTF